MTFSELEELVLSDPFVKIYCFGPLPKKIKTLNGEQAQQAIDDVYTKATLRHEMYVKPHIRLSAEARKQQLLQKQAEEEQEKNRFLQDLKQTKKILTKFRRR